MNLTKWANWIYVSIYYEVTGGLEMAELITGEDSLPSLYGGYLSIIKDGKEIHIFSVPSLVFAADRYRDSVSENDDEFEDDEGNEFSISIRSSNIGVEWELDLSAKNGDDKTLVSRIKMEYQSNDY